MQTRAKRFCVRVQMKEAYPSTFQSGRTYDAESVCLLMDECFVQFERNKREEQSPAVGLHISLSSLDLYPYISQ